MDRRLSDEQVKQLIGEMAVTGVRHYELATELGCDPSSLSLALRPVSRRPLPHRMTFETAMAALASLKRKKGAAA